MINEQEKQLSSDHKIATVIAYIFVLLGPYYIGGVQKYLLLVSYRCA
jgi:hypothetical protein